MIVSQYEQFASMKLTNMQWLLSMQYLKTKKNYLTIVSIFFFLILFASKFNFMNLCKLQAIQGLTGQSKPLWYLTLIDKTNVQHLPLSHERHLCILSLPDRRAALAGGRPVHYTRYLNNVNPTSQVWGRNIASSIGTWVWLQCRHVIPALKERAVQA